MGKLLALSLVERPKVSNDAIAKTREYYSSNASRGIFRVNYATKSELNKNDRAGTMKGRDSQDQLDRREFFQSAGVLAIGAATLMSPGAALASGVLKPGSKPWRGLFPIAQTLFTADDKLDLDYLAAGGQILQLRSATGPPVAAGLQRMDHPLRERAARRS